MEFRKTGISKLNLMCNFYPNTFFVFILLSVCSYSQNAIDYSELELPEKPNIVWIVAEDQSAYIPTYGDSTITTTHISKLAKEGVVFTNVYSPSGVCAPSRAAIATGMYPTRFGAMHMRTGPWYNPDVTEKEIRAGNRVYEAKPPAGTHLHSYYLRKNGYYCTNNPKEDYQFRSEITAWDESSKSAHWKNRPDEEPFFAIFNFMETHESSIWANEGDSLWVSENMEVPIDPYLPATKKAKKDIRRMYSNLKEMDAEVGRLLKELEETGELENTIIFWFTDHGGPLPRQKRTVYDSGLHIPLIVRFPNKQFSGRKDEQLISFVDFKPTLLSLAGIKPPEYVDGRAWMGEFMDPEKRNFIYAAGDRFDEFHDRVRAVRDNRFKYIRNYFPDKPYYMPVSYREQMDIMKELLRLKDKDSLNEYQAQWFRTQKAPEELFDTKNDPHELNNLAEDPRYKKKLVELRDALQQWINDTGDKGMIPEQEYIEEIGNYKNEPITKKPEIRIENGSWIITCETKGASIGYQLLNNKNDELKDSWNIYTVPVKKETGKILVAKAHRIGFKPSKIQKIIK